MRKIKSPHDQFVRAILADKNVAIDYFKSCLPEFILEKLDFSTLVQTGDSYISKHFKQTFSDVVFNCQKKGGGQNVKVSLLIEHKSYIDKYVPIQLANYIFSGLKKQIDNKEKLSIIIPILFYHGSETWEYKELIVLFEDLDDEWKKFVPNFSYIYNKLREMSDGQLESLSNQFLMASLLTLKHFKESSWLEENAPRIFTRMQGVEQNLLELLIVYFFDRSESVEPKIIEILELIPENIKDKIMSTLDIFYEKGKVTGKEEGWVGGKEEGKLEGTKETLLRNTRNMLLKGFDLSMICEVLEVSIEFVKDVKLQMNLENDDE